MPATTLITTVIKQTVIPSTRAPTKPTQTMHTTEMTENQGLLTPLGVTVVKPTLPQKYATLELTQPIDRFPGADDRKDKLRSINGTLRTIQMKVLQLQPKI